MMEDEIPFNVLVMESHRPTLVSLCCMLLNGYIGVQSCSNAEDGLDLTRGIAADIIMVSVDLRDMNGLDFLEILSKEMDQLPAIIMMASEENKDDIFRASYLGACDYILKPVKKDYVRNMWRHVVRMRKANLTKEPKLLALPPGGTKPKNRVAWTANLHAQFVDAVDKSGYENATPAKILKVMKTMGCDNLTRHNIATHFKKYKVVVSKKRQQNVVIAEAVEGETNDKSH